MALVQVNIQIKQELKDKIDALVKDELGTFRSRSHAVVYALNYVFNQGHGLDKKLKVKK